MAVVSLAAQAFAALNDADSALVFRWPASNGCLAVLEMPQTITTLGAEFFAAIDQARLDSRSWLTSRSRRNAGGRRRKDFLACLALAAALGRFRRGLDSIFQVILAELLFLRPLIASIHLAQTVFGFKDPQSFLGSWRRCLVGSGTFFIPTWSFFFVDIHRGVSRSCCSIFGLWFGSDHVGVLGEREAIFACCYGDSRAVAKPWKQ
mmetsp:Transcript_18563/g.46010  ORF Transcript_18563/g.46010 Transcript_18563/m.46010 type:complete len:206 (+) Transcript_18563:1646-2263(+)